MAGDPFTAEMQAAVINGVNVEFTDAAQKRKLTLILNKLKKFRRGRKLWLIWRNIRLLFLWTIFRRGELLCRKTTGSYYGEALQTPNCFRFWCMKPAICISIKTAPSI